MIAKISRGWGAGGLVRYLMGPGRFNEHTNQRVIASWDWAPELHQPPRDGSACGFDVRGLTQDLTLPAEAAGVPHQRRSDEPTRRRGPVWHCSLRNAAGDRVLTDAEWAEVAEDLMDRTGIAPRGDHGGCRWVVIRHADDHIHIAAMLVRQDNGRRVHPRNDYYRAAEVCRDAESRFGLTSPAPADRTAAPECTRAETEKAARRGAEETSREWLRRAARTAAVQATDPESFFRRLADLGVKVRPREMPPGHLVGYAVAAPGDVNADGRPVWFGGRRLASDLSLPALLARWRSAPPAPDPIPPLPQEHSRVGQAERAAAVQQATAAAQHATDAPARRPAERAGGRARHRRPADRAVRGHPPQPDPGSVGGVRHVRPRRPYTDAAPAAAVAAGGPRTPPRRVAARGGTVGEPRPRGRQRDGRADGGRGRTGRGDRRVPRAAAVSGPSRGRATHRPCAAPPVDRWRPPGSRAGPNTTDPRWASTSGHRRRRRARPRPRSPRSAARGPAVGRGPGGVGDTGPRQGRSR